MIEDIFIQSCIDFQAKLPAVLRIYRETLITEMKATIKSTVAELLPILLPRPLESDLVTGERAVDSHGPILIYYVSVLA